MQQEADTNGGPIAGIFPDHRHEPELPDGYSWSREKAYFCPEHLLVPMDAVDKDGRIETKQRRLERHCKRDGGLVFCHRGLYERASTIVENSSGALKNGTRQGYHLHELDAFVWSKLDEAFMGHDQVADRVTPKTGPWQRYTFQQVLQTILVSRHVSDAFIDIVPSAERGSASTTSQPTFSSTYEAAQDRVLGVLDAFWHDLFQKSGRTIQLDLREHDLAKAIPHYCFHLSKVPSHTTKTKARGAHETLIYKMFESTIWKGYNIHYSCFEELEQEIQKHSIKQYGANYFERRHLLLCPPLIMVFFADELLKLAKNAPPTRNPDGTMDTCDSYSHVRRVAMESISSFVGIDVGVGVGQAPLLSRDPHQQRQQRSATYNFILEIGYSGLGLWYNVSNNTAIDPFTGDQITDQKVVSDALLDRALIDVAEELRETCPGVLLASCTRMPDVITPKGNFKASFTTAELGPWPPGEKGIASQLRAIHGGLYPQSDIVVADNPAAEIFARVWIDKKLRLDRKKLLNGPKYYEWLSEGVSNGGQNQLDVNLMRDLNTKFAANTVAQSAGGLRVKVQPQNMDNTVIHSWKKAGAISPSPDLAAGLMSLGSGKDTDGDDVDQVMPQLAIGVPGKRGFDVVDPPEARRGFASIFSEAQAVRGGDGGTAALALPVRVRTAGQTYTISTLEYANSSVAKLQAYNAATEGRITDLQNLLMGPNKTDINAVAGIYGTPLGAACANNKVSVVQWLLTKGAQVDYKSPFSTPLELACRKGHVDIVKLLIEARASPNGIVSKASEDHVRQHSPLWAACSYNRPEIVEILLKSGADPNTGMDYGETPFGVACSGGYTVIVNQLLEHLRKRYGTDTYKRHLSIGLQHACAADVSIEGRDALIAKLLGLGADINFHEAKPHGTALIAACKHGHLPTVQLLLDRGANVDQIPPPQTGHNIYTNYTALTGACSCGHLPVVQLLLRRKADPNFIPYKGWTTALEAACSKRDAVPIIQELLAKGADVKLGRPLYLACLGHAEDAVDLLLRSGAPVTFSLLREEQTTPRIFNAIYAKAARNTKFAPQPLKQAQLVLHAQTLSGGRVLNLIDHSTRPLPIHMKGTDPLWKPMSPCTPITKQRPKDKQIMPRNEPSPLQLAMDDMMSDKRTQSSSSCDCLICLLDTKLQADTARPGFYPQNPVTYTLRGIDLRKRRL